jgi:succinoglycan biosynthesis protein ExoA
MGSGASLPTVSAVIPVRNDAADLPAAVESVLAQGYPGGIEVVIAVGPSTDDSQVVADKLASEHESVSVVVNPSGFTSAALNAAIDAASGDVIVRVDARSVLPAGYVGRAVEVLGSTGAGNVGGVQDATGDERMEMAIAVAMTSPFGAGDAKFHYGGEAGPTDTVYLGVFDRAALAEVGGFDESLIRNQDYEMNWRLREAGHVVWFDPELRVTYRPRPDLASLAQQYFQYGRYKRLMLSRNPRSLKARQLAAPVLVVGLAAGIGLTGAGRRWGLLAPLGYAAGTTAAAIHATRDRSDVGWGDVAAAFATMHISWGIGFLTPNCRG